MPQSRAAPPGAAFLLGMTPRRRCSTRPLSRALHISPPAIDPPPCVAAHARDALRATAAVSAGDACCCSTSRRQRCCQWCSHRPRNEDGGARPCSAGFSANEPPCRAPADKYPWLHPTWGDRSKSSGPPVRASFYGADSSVLSWHGYSIRLHEKRMRGVLMDAPRQEALARARPEISWFRMPDSET